MRKRASVPFERTIDGGEGSGKRAKEESRGRGTLFSNDQLTRYSRQIILAEVGLEGQKRLLDAKVLVIGAGGLGSPSSIYLAAAGVGTIGIIDADRVDRSNLHRQVLHFDKDVDRPKTGRPRSTSRPSTPTSRSSSTGASSTR